MPFIATAFAAVTTFFKGSVIASALVRLAVSAGASLLAQKLGPKPKTPGMRIGGVGSGEDFPRATVIGRYMAPASLVYHNSSGAVGRTPNAFYTVVMALDDRPGAALVRVHMGDKWVTLDTDNPHPDRGFPVVEYPGAAWVKYYDGTQTVADPFLVATFGADPDYPWTSAEVGRGVCYVIVTTQLTNRNRFPNGQPALGFELDGAGLYDPRLDATVGGDGPQRADQPATWVPTRNLALLAGAVSRGIPMPGGRVWGGGVAVQPAVLAAAANACDVPVAGRPRFRGGLQIALPEAEPAAALESLLEAGLGFAAYTGSDLALMFGAPAVPLVAITDDDIVITEPQSEESFPGLRATVNALRVQHPAPDRFYAPVHTAERVDSAALAADGTYLPRAIDLTACTDHDQAQDVRNGLLADGRRFRTHLIALPPDLMLRLKPGDTVTWSSARYNFAAKLFEVADYQLDLGTLFGFVTLRERDPDDVGIPGATLPLPPSLVPGPLAARVVPGFAVGPAEIYGGDGAARRPGVAISWLADASEDARSIVWAVRLSGDTGEGVESAPHDTQTGSAIEERLPATAYEYRARLILDRETEWTDWLVVTTPDVRLGGVDLEAGIRQDLVDLRGWIGSGIPIEAIPGLTEIVGLPEIVAQQAADLRGAVVSLRETRDRIRAIAAEAMQIGAADHLQREELRRLLIAQVDGLRASFSETIQVIVTESAALASRTTTLEAETLDMSAAITAVEIAFASETEALAALITSLSVGNANAFDQLRLWRWDSTLESWTGSPNAPAITTPGWIRPGGAASSLLSPTGLAWNPVTFRQARMLLRRVGTPTWVGQFWWSGVGQSFDAARRITADDPIWDDNGFASVTVDMTDTALVDAIRLDLASGVDGSNYVEVDWLGLGSPSPGASSAEVTQEIAARISADEALALLISSLTVRMDDAETGQAGLVTVTSGHTAQIAATEAGLTAAGERLDVIEVEVNDPDTGLNALATAIDVLTSLVETTESGGVSLLAQAARQLEARLRDVSAEVIEGLFGARAADISTREFVASAAQTLTTRITTTDEQLEIVAAFVTELQAAIPELATAQALEALQATVTAVQGMLTVEAAKIVQLQSTVNNSSTGVAATASAVSSLTTRVTTAEGGLVAQSDFLTQLSAATTPGNPSTANFRMAVVSGPTGYSRIGLETRVGGAGAYRGAAMFLDTPNNTALPTRVIVNADRFSFVTGAGLTVPFTVSGSELRVSVPIQSANYVANSAGFRLDPVSGVIEAEALTVRRRNIARGLTSRAFIQQAAVFDGAAPGNTLTNTPQQFEGTFPLGTITFNMPAAAADVPQLVIIRPFVGGKAPFIGQASAGWYGIAYEFRMRLIRAGATITDSGFGFSPFWQFQWNGNIVRMYYGCVPEQIRFYLENDAGGAIQANDQVVVDFRQYKERTALAGGPFVSSETIELDVEYFFR